MTQDEEHMVRVLSYTDGGGLILMCAVSKCYFVAEFPDGTSVKELGAVSVDHQQAMDFGYDPDKAAEYMKQAKKERDKRG